MRFPEMRLPSLLRRSPGKQLAAVLAEHAVASDGSARCRCGWAPVGSGVPDSDILVRRVEHLEHVAARVRLAARMESDAVLGGDRLEPVRTVEFDHLTGALRLDGVELPWQVNSTDGIGLSWEDGELQELTVTFWLRWGARVSQVGEAGR